MNISAECSYLEVKTPQNFDSYGNFLFIWEIAPKITVVINRPRGEDAMVFIEKNGSLESSLPD